MQGHTDTRGYTDIEGHTDTRGYMDIQGHTHGHIYRQHVN
jgi:hypothetical protein